MAGDTHFRTDFPWRAVVIATVIFILSIFSAINLLVQSEAYSFKEMLLSIFAILLLLYLLFFLNITVLEFRKDEVFVSRPFRFINSQKVLAFSGLDKVIFYNDAIGVPKLVFRLKKGRRIRIRYYQAGGRGELRIISSLLKDKGVELIYKRFGSKIYV